MFRGMIAGAVCLFALALVVHSSVDGAAGDKITIKDVMKTAMKGGLCGKVASGKASDDEKKELIKLFTALTKLEPPKGDKAAFQEKAKALLDAAKADDGKALKKAANCAACHKEFKG
jgi:hypothetical protein